MANKTTSTKNPHFLTPILAVASLETISIPKAFLRRYLDGEDCEGTATLMSEKRCKPWIVGIKKRWFRDGWEEFARAHELQFGDLLVFRHQGGLNFQVVVFDTTACEKAYPPSHASVADHAKKKKIPRDVSSSSKWTTMAQDLKEPPNFTMVIQPYQLKWYRLLMPFQFAKENNLTNILDAFPGKSCPITLKIPNGKSWEVILKYTPNSHSIYMRSGWSKFSYANKLNVGDICTFKLLSSGMEHIVMEVSISHSKFPHTKNTTSVSKSNPPQFSVTLKASNFICGSMCIPVNFARKNGLANRICPITLEDPVGRLWKVNLKSTNCVGRPRILGGWLKFLHANKLKIGDLCTFKLMSSGSRNVAMEVSFCRSMTSV